MGAVLTGLDERVEFIRVVGELIGLQDDQLATAHNDRGCALDGGIGQFAELPFGFADGASLHTGQMLVHFCTVVKPSEEWPLR